MKKWIPLLILCLLTVGCSTKRSAPDLQIQKRFKTEGFRTVYHRDRIKDIDILSFESKEIEIFYNSKRVMGAIQGDAFYSPTTNKGYTGGLSDCIYSFHKQEYEKYCTNEEISALKKLKKSYKNTLKELELTEKEFYSFAKQSLSTYLNEVASLSDGEKLERLDFKKRKGVYSLHFDTDEDEMLIPDTLRIDLKHKKMYFDYSYGIITLNWNTPIIFNETRTDGTICIYDYTNKAWMQSCDGAVYESKFQDYYDFFLEFKEEYQLSFQ